ncbi:MAG: archease [Nanoarchaeota archaeon]
MKYRFLDHTADIKLQAFGKDKQEAFANAALALAHLICEKPVRAIELRTVEATGHDDKQLLYAWLEQVLLLQQTEKFLLAEVKELSIEGNALSATVLGDNASSYALDEDVKAITYHDMEIKKEQEWTVQVVVDI